jgi:hypothetical protein
MKTQDNIKIGDKYNYYGSGRYWGEVIDILPPSQGDIKIRMSDGAVKCFGLYEVKNWLRDCILIIDDEAVK